MSYQPFSSKMNRYRTIDFWEAGRMVAQREYILQKKLGYIPDNDLILNFLYEQFNALPAPRGPAIDPTMYHCY